MVMRNKESVLDQLSNRLFCRVSEMIEVFFFKTTDKNPVNHLLMVNEERNVSVIKH